MNDEQIDILRADAFLRTGSNTPKTDALRKGIDNGSAAEAEMTSLAGKFERERDEARKAFAIATDECVVAQAQLRKATRSYWHNQ